jgi:hypothetical protein
MSIPTYAIFGGQTYYPAGGFNDIYAFANTFKEALEIYDEARLVGSKPMKRWGWTWHGGYEETTTTKKPRTWVHIVNLKTQKVVVKNTEY